MARAHIMNRGLAGGLLALALAATLASPAAASSGGASSNGGTAASTGPIGTPVSSTVSAVAGTITFTPATVVEGKVTVAEGTLGPGDAGQPVSLEVQQASGVWDAVATRTVASDGSFSISWRASAVGEYTTRVVSGALAATSTSVSTPETTLQVLKGALATWYGPGFYGHRTACGETMSAHILGVAHRTLPCGTPVTITYNGASITVPVIDRGPYANGATFDLTAATAQALGIEDTVTIGYSSALGKKIAASYWYAPGTGPTGASGTTGVSGTTGITGTTSTTEASGGSLGGGALAPF